jgi:hypothetical protein
MFCLDVLRALRTELHSGPVSAKAGIHSGPVTAGLIGQTRRYYRIFGDTVNVASVSKFHELRIVHMLVSSLYCVPNSTADDVNRSC